MAYWLDDGFDTWPETIRAGSAAAGLYVRSGSWIARSISNGSITDAVIPAEVATMYGTPEWIAKLVAVGLWKAEGAGYRDVRYFRMGNPTAETVQKRRADAADRQRRFREGAKRKKPVTRDKTRDSRVSNAVSNGASHSSPSLPPSKEGEGTAPPAPQAARGGPPDNPDWRGLPDVDAPRRPPPTTARQHLRLAGLAGGPRCPHHPGQPAGNCSLCPPEAP